LGSWAGMVVGRLFQNYPRGWAQAGNTPFRGYKGTNYEGAMRSPLIISWPGGIKARGEMRDQFVNTMTSLPTILELAGLTMPEVYRGIPQLRVAGRSFSEASTTRRRPRPIDTSILN